MKIYVHILNDGKWHSMSSYMSKAKSKKLERERGKRTTHQKGQPSFSSLLMEQINGWIFFLSSFLLSFWARWFLFSAATHTHARTTEHILPLNCLFSSSSFLSFYMIRCCRCKLEMLVLFTKCKHFSFERTHLVFYHCVSLFFFVILTYSHSQIYSFFNSTDKTFEQVSELIEKKLWSKFILNS